MSFTDEQSRRLDEVVSGLAPDAQEAVDKLVKEFAEAEVERRFGAQPDVPALRATREHFRGVVAGEMAEALVCRLTERLLGSHVAA